MRARRISLLATDTSAASPQILSVIRIRPATHASNDRVNSGHFAETYTYALHLCHPSLACGTATRPAVPKTDVPADLATGGHESGGWEFAMLSFPCRH